MVFSMSDSRPTGIDDGPGHGMRLEKKITRGEKPSSMHQTHRQALSDESEAGPFHGRHLEERVGWVVRVWRDLFMPRPCIESVAHFINIITLT
jgi:hypothetical protein